MWLLWNYTAIPREIWYFKSHEQPPLTSNFKLIVIKIVPKTFAFTMPFLIDILGLLGCVVTDGGLDTETQSVPESNTISTLPTLPC